MKRFFAIILASVLLLTACGKQVTTHRIEDVFVCLFFNGSFFASV